MGDGPARMEPNLSRSARLTGSIRAKDYRLKNKKCPAQPGVLLSDFTLQSIQGNPLRISAEVPVRLERRPIQRARRAPARERLAQRKRIIVELAVARQHFDASVKPGALGDVDPGARTGLIGDVGAVRTRGHALAS